MKVYDISLLIPAIILTTFIATMKFLMKKVLRCLWVMEYMDIGILRTATLYLVITDVIIAVIMAEVDLGHKIPSTLSLSILYFIVVVLVV